MKLLLLSCLLLVLCTPVLAQGFSIERYLNIRSVSFASLSPDGSRIAFLTNITGTFQVWMMPAEGGYPEQLTAYPDHVSFIKWSPSGQGLVFGVAAGGNENTQLFWMSPDGSSVRPLTSDAAVRHDFGDFSRDGSRIYYASNKRHRDFFDIYSLELLGGRERLIYRQDGSNAFGAVNHDGTKIVVSRTGTELSQDNDLYLVDVASGAEVHLTPHSDAAQFGDVQFTADGLVFAHNQQREFVSLAQMRLKDGAVDDWGEKNREIRILDETPWDAGNVKLSRDGGLLAYTLNREGFSELYLRRRPFDGAAEQIKLPARGVVGNVEFSHDGRKLAFIFTSPAHTPDVWVYDLQSKVLQQITKSSRGAIPQASFVQPDLIRYNTFDGREISAWYYKPQAPMTTPSSRPAQAKLPVIISVHGGPESQERPIFKPLYQYYLSRGYAVLATNVRGSIGYGKTFSHLDDVRKREDAVKDLAFAVAWLKNAGGADPKRIALTGVSYGGYMTMAGITLYPELFAAAVNTVGIVNWETFLENTSGYRRRQREVEYGRLDTEREFLRSISPIHRIGKIKAPLFVIHGKNDPRVPYTEAEQVVKALRERGAAVEYQLYEDEGHGVSKLANQLDVYPRVADFLDRHMK